MLVTKGIETIDVSGLDTDFFGHSYYGDHPVVLGDIIGVIRLHQAPGERGLKEKTKNGLPYWECGP